MKLFWKSSFRLRSVRTGNGSDRVLFAAHITEPHRYSSRF